VYIQRLLAINMATFAALGTILLGLGERNPTLSIVAVVAAVAAVWITDILGWFHLNRRVTNLAVLLAVLRSLWELFHIQGAVQVVAIANLLAYVMIILLFQEKDSRTWWHIALLSLLQVAASATFFQGVWFAPMLIVYFFVGSSALALLFLHHERTRYHQLRHRPIVPRDTRTWSERLGVNWQRLGKIIVATFIVGPVSLFLDYGETDDQRAQRRRSTPKTPRTGRWSLIYEEAEFTGSADNLGGRAGVGLEFYRHLASLVPGTLLVAVLLFLLIPRFGRINFALPQFGRLTWNNERTEPLRVVGFSDTVELGELGLLVEDAEEVMKLQFHAPRSDTFYQIQGPVYLRGALLSHYEQGKWEFRGSGFVRRRRDGRNDHLYDLSSRGNTGLVWQTVGIKPLDRQELFCIWPFVAVEPDDRLMIDLDTERLIRRRDRSRSMVYRLGTYGLVDGVQVPLTPSPLLIDQQHLTAINEEDLPTLIATADRWIEESKLPPNQWVERARYLEEKLASSGQFAYSLEGQARDPLLDPIEDFVKNTPYGHCEYFATALTLMLRSQGIPARMVVGYVSDEYDMLGEYYRVRQRDAHTWVEAYIPPAYLPQEKPFGQPDVDWSSGGWLRLDATPAMTVDTTTMSSFVDNVEDWFQWMRVAWVSYVVEMDSTRQQAAVYGPIKDFVTQVKDGLIDPTWWKQLWNRIKALPAQLKAALSDVGWFSWLGAALLAGTLGFGYVVYRLLRLLLRFILWLWPQGRSPDSRQARVAFYRRLETVMARRGLRRRPGQTQREFATEAAELLANGQAHDMADLSLTIADAFYDVRFGGARLDKNRLERVEQALRRIERSAAHGGG